MATQVPKLLHHPASGGFTATPPSTETRTDGLRPTEDLGARAAIAGRLFGEHATPVMVGRFRVSRRIGAGAMGRVYEARDLELDRRVALKLVGEPDGGATSARMLREARSLARLSHPHVVQIFDVGPHEGSVFLAMEYVDGPSLLAWQAGGHRWRSVLDKYMQAGEGLAAVHGTGVVHRDFKPANVLLDLDGRVKLADFGVAIVEASASTVPNGVIDRDPTTVASSRLTQTGAALGTPAYMSPEQLRAVEVDARSDQFSFCVALYEAVFGQLPYTVEQRRDREGRVAPGTRNGPSWLRTVLLRGLAIRPEDRWPDMRALLRALRRGANRGRNLALAGTVLGGAAMVAFGAAYAASPGCSDAASAIEPVWNEARREELRDAFAGTGLPFAATTTHTLIAGLDAHAEAWSVARVEVCHDHRVDGVRSAEFYDASMACLDRRLDELGTLVDRLVTVDPDAVTSAGELLSTLAPVAQCLDLDTLRADGRAADPPDREGLHALLLDARLELAVGRPAEALARADAASERARGLGADHSLADAELLRGQSLQALEQWPEASNAYLQAVRVAEGAHYDELAVQVWRRLVDLELYGRENGELCATWLLLLDAAVNRIGNPPRARANYLVAEARKVAQAGDEAAAERALRAALELLDDDALGDDADRREATRHLANSLARQKRFAAAEELYLRDMDDVRARWGDRHPEIADLEFDLGLLEHDRHDNVAAHRWLSSALSIELEVFGADSRRVASTLTMLAQTEKRLGMYAVARMHAERAWSIQRKLPLGHSERSAGLGVLVSMAIVTDDAHEMLARSREFLALGPTDPARIAQLEYNVAWSLCELEGCVGAAAHLDRATRTVPDDMVEQGRFAVLRARIDDAR